MRLFLIRMMRESKRLKKKVMRKSAKVKKPMTKRRMVTSADAAATTVKAKRRPRWKDPKPVSQMMRTISSRSTQDLQKDQSSLEEEISHNHLQNLQLRSQNHQKNQVRVSLTKSMGSMSEEISTSSPNVVRRDTLMSSVITSW
jgi:hypothetical protein